MLMVRRILVSLASKLKAADKKELAAKAFYIITGIILFVLLPFSNYPPHVALIGVLSFITAYSIQAKTVWTKWLIIVLFILSTVFSLYAVLATGFTNWEISTGLIVYVAFVWIFTAYFTVFRDR